MRGGLLLAVSSHISLCSTLYTRVQRPACPDQIFVHQRLTKLSLLQTFPEDTSVDTLKQISYFLQKRECSFLHPNPHKIISH